MRVSSAVFIALCITNQLLFLISDHKNGDRRGIEGAMVLASYSKPVIKLKEIFLPFFQFAFNLVIHLLLTFATFVYYMSYL